MWAEEGAAARDAARDAAWAAARDAAWATARDAANLQHAEIVRKHIPIERFNV